MADVKYDIEINSTEAQRNLTNLQKKLSGLTSAFDSLKTAVAGIAFGSVIANAIQLADGIDDISAATGVATENILGFSRAVLDNGGTVEGAQNAIVRLIATIDDAAGGSLEAQQAFRAVGVSLDDLRKLSEQEILGKVITGLGKISNVSEQVALKQKLLGKEFRSVAVDKLADDYDKATSASRRYATAISTMAGLQGKADAAIFDFKVALIESLAPLSKLAADINVTVEDFKKLIAAVAAVGAAFLTFTVAGRVFTLVRAAWVGLVTAIESAGGIITLIANFGRSFQAIISNIGQSTSVFNGLRATLSAVGSVLAEILAPALAAIKPLLIPIGTAAAAVFGYMSESVDGLINKTKGLIETLSFGLIKFQQGAGAGRGDGAAELAQRRKDAEAAMASEKARREVIDRNAQAMSKFNIELSQSAENTYIALQWERNRLFFEERMITLGKLKNTLSEDEIEIQKALSDASDKRLRADIDLRQQIERLQAELKAGSKDETLAGRIAALEEQRKKVADIYKEHERGLPEYISKLQSARLLEEARKRDMENMIKSIEQLNERQQALGDTIKNINDQKIDIKFETEQLGRSPVERQIEQIRENARKSALEASRAFAAAFEDTGDGMTPERAKELADGLKKIEESYKGIVDQQVKNLESSRTFASGWREAFNQYKDEATNAAEQAKTMFQSVTRGLEDAIVKFVQTGKFNFKDLVNSVIADFARIQARRLILGLFGGGSGGDLFSSLLGGIPGRAIGGPVMGNSPYIVGERGPELFVPKTAGNIVPNNQLGQSTQVVYNINAVDAASFRQMLAREPEFLYAVTERGRSSIPGGRR